MNTPILTQSEEEIAPWNQKFKKIHVDICQCLSTTVDIEVPENFEDYDNKELLENFVRDQIILPSEIMLEYSPDCWYVDELCINI